VYYDDETDAHRYLGQGYSPLAEENAIASYESFFEDLQRVTGKILS